MNYIVQQEAATSANLVLPHLHCSWTHIIVYYSESELIPKMVKYYNHTVRRGTNRNVLDVLKSPTFEESELRAQHMGT